MSRILIALFGGVLVMLVCCPLARAADGPVGDFDGQADVGTVEPAGSAEFDKIGNRYVIKSSGENIWNAHDDFHFVYRKVSGDLVLTADVSFVGEGKNAHRKAGWMIRQSLDADAPYVDVMVHGDGLIGLQYRTEKGAKTVGVKSTIKAPATVRLERHGNTFSVFVAANADKADKSGEFQLAGSIDVALKDPVYAGLAVCSHDPKVTESAIFTNVSLKKAETPAPREPGK
jgi:regulation of enolase protein 1 (concanavalin A-like superfamily)